jgi:twitching motility protein PilT
VVFEILLGNDVVRNIIREDKNQELYSQMQLGAQQGMRPLDDSLAELVRKYVITLEEAFPRCVHPEQLRKMFKTPSGKNILLTGARKY